MRRMHVKISLSRECNRSTEDVIRLINELASSQRDFPYPNPRDTAPMLEHYGELASDVDFRLDSPFREPKDTRDTCVFFMPRATLLQMGTAL